jgi:hypothetical protein
MDWTGWTKMKLTKKQKKALELGRIRSKDSVCPFDVHAGPIPDELKNEKITVTIPKAALTRKKG